MPIVKTKSNKEIYKYLSRFRDIHYLSGRAENKHATYYINHNIISKMGFSLNDIVVDVGCGDGSLLNGVATEVRNGIGIAPNIQEIEKLSRIYSNRKNIKFIKSDIENIEIGDAKATKVVCNGVILLLEDKEKVRNALGELARIVADGGLVWIGEVANLNEFVQKSYGDSIFKWLMYMLKEGDIAGFLSGMRKIITSLCTNEYFIIHPKKMFAIKDTEFIGLCREYGLLLVTKYPHKSINKKGELIKSGTRTNFIFRKQSVG